MNTPKDLKQINKYISSHVQENIHLDYKQSRAIDRSRTSEISKDVAAFANSDGGVIIYGVIEQGHLPVNTDSGVDHNDYSREWLEQIINSNISPRIDGIEIIQIPKSKDRSLYVVDIPISFRGPHQSKDKKYHKRFNFQSVPMEDYEIRDVRNRRRILAPLINFYVDIKHGVLTNIIVENVGNFPAKDVHFTFPGGIVWPDGRDLPHLLDQGSTFFPQNQKFSFYYHSFVDIINNDDVPQTLDVEVSYIHPAIGERITEYFHIDFTDFLNSAVEESELSNLGKKIEKELKNIAGEIRDQNKILGNLENISSATGLVLSYKTLKNLFNIHAGENKIEKITPYFQNYKVFMEILGVDISLAYKLSDYFMRYENEKELLELEGMTDAIYEKLILQFNVDI